MGAQLPTAVLRNCRRMLMRGRAKGFVPCTALGVMELIARSGVELQGKKAVVIGDSNVVGTPLAMLLRDSGVAALTVCHRSSFQDLFAQAAPVQEHARVQADVCLPSTPGPAAYSLASQQLAEGQGIQASQQAQHALNGTSAPHGSSSACTALHEQQQQAVQPMQQAADAALQDLPAIARSADIVIVAVGRAELVKQDWIKPGAVVIDVGINITGDVESQQYQVVGDVASAEVAQIASAITPVPGGVGPMTIAAVLHNTIQSAEAHAMKHCK